MISTRTRRTPFCRLFHRFSSQPNDHRRKTYPRMWDVARLAYRCTDYEAVHTSRRCETRKSRFVQNLRPIHSDFLCFTESALDANRFVGSIMLPAWSFAFEVHHIGFGRYICGSASMGRPPTFLKMKQNKLRGCAKQNSQQSHFIIVYSRT